MHVRGLSCQRRLLTFSFWPLVSTLPSWGKSGGRGSSPFHMYCSVLSEMVTDIRWPKRVSLYDSWWKIWIVMNLSFSIHIDPACLVLCQVSVGWADFCHDQGHQPLCLPLSRTSMDTGFWFLVMCAGFQVSHGAEMVSVAFFASSSECFSWFFSLLSSVSLL